MTRPETGPMKFPDDWTGVFIRGDHAFFYAGALRLAIEELNKIPVGPVERMNFQVLGSLLVDLENCHHSKADRLPPQLAELLVAADNGERQTIIPEPPRGEGT